MSRASWFFHTPVQINLSSTINMQTKGSIKSLPCRGLLLSFYELMKLGVLAKWTLKWPLNQEVIFFILIVLSCPWDFFSELFNGKFFSPAFRIYLHFCQNTHQKAANLTFGLILPVTIIPGWFLGGQSRVMQILSIHSLTRSLQSSGKRGFHDGTDRHTDRRLTDIATLYIIKKCAAGHNCLRC